MEDSTLIEQKNSTITIFFNNPYLLPTDSGEANEDEEIFAQDKQQNSINYSYDLSLQLPTEALGSLSLENLRSLINSQIMDNSENENKSYHFKRNGLNSTPQLKDESKSLNDLEIGDQAILHLQLGTGCKEGEHMIIFELDRSTSSEAKSAYIPFGVLPVSEKFTVLQLKQLIFSKWDTLTTSIQASSLTGEDGEVVPILSPQSANHIRLRDFKGGKQSGPLRDDRILGRCLLGLTDGRKLIIQVLEKEEHIAADDILLSLRLASYFGDDKALSAPIELPMQRSNTIKNLFERISAMFPQLHEPIPEDLLAQSSTVDPAMEYINSIPELKYFAFARGYSSGPTLTLKNSLKLKWNDPVVLKEALTATLDRPPLNLRDGSIIVVRGVADFAKADVIMRQKKQQAALEAEARPVSRGAGAAAVRARLRAKQQQEKEATEAAAATSEVPVTVIVGDSALPTDLTAPVTPECNGQEAVPALPTPDKLKSAQQPFTSPLKEQAEAASMVATDGIALPPPQKSPRL